jgi:hypothetical protein
MPNHSSLNNGIFNIKKLSNSVQNFFCLKIIILKHPVKIKDFDTPLKEGNKKIPKSFGIYIVEKFLKLFYDCRFVPIGFKLAIFVTVV